ncbi:hypothetical protein GCM10022631_26120 [Deinococcus rubellus]|uniref:hypothetical protein n=1 Tax=Deinococcus rubellus TaxID=1889240 RepID=UPI0031E9FF91
MQHESVKKKSSRPTALSPAERLLLTLEFWREYRTGVQSIWLFPSRLTRVILSLLAFLTLTGMAFAQNDDSYFFLPKYGAVLTSGGLMSDRTLLVYDLREGTLRSEVATRGALLKPDTKLRKPIVLTSRQRKKVDRLLTSIAQTKDKRVFGNSVPIADYIVWMQMRLDGTVISINSYGPPHGTLKTLNTYLWNIVSEAEPGRK